MITSPERTADDTEETKKYRAFDSKGEVDHVARAADLRLERGDTHVEVDAPGVVNHEVERAASRPGSRPKPGLGQSALNDSTRSRGRSKCRPRSWLSELEGARLGIGAAVQAQTSSTPGIWSSVARRCAPSEPVAPVSSTTRGAPASVTLRGREAAVAVLSRPASRLFRCASCRSRPSATRTSGRRAPRDVQVPRSAHWPRPPRPAGRGPPVLMMRENTRYAPSESRPIAKEVRASCRQLRGLRLRRAFEDLHDSRARARRRRVTIELRCGRLQVLGVFVDRLDERLELLVEGRADHGALVGLGQSCRWPRRAARGCARDRSWRTPRPGRWRRRSSAARAR